MTGEFRATKFSGDGAGDFSGAKFIGTGSGDFRDSWFKGKAAGNFNRVQFSGAHSGTFGNIDSSGTPVHPKGPKQHTEFVGENAGDFTQAVCQGREAGNFREARFVGQDAGIFTESEFQQPDFVGVHYGMPDDAVTNTCGEKIGHSRTDNRDADRPTEKQGLFADVRFEDADFANATFKRPVSFKDACFRGDTSFAGATFEDQVKFEDASFGGATFQNAMFQGKTTFDDAIFTDNVTFIATGEERTPQFDGGSPPSFKRTEFRQRVNFSRCGNLEGTSFGDATLSWADFTGVDLTDVDFTGADLTGSTLDGATIEGVRFENAVLESVNVDSETFRDGRGYVCCYDPTKGAASMNEDSTPVRDPEIAATVSQKLETVARANTLSRAVGQLFVARKRVERHQYFERMRDTDRSPSDRLYWFSLWTRSWAANLVLYYGESPWRVILTSASIILLCALLYPFGLMRPTGGDPILYCRLGAVGPGVLRRSVRERSDVHHGWLRAVSARGIRTTALDC